MLLSIILLLDGKGEKGGGKRGGNESFARKKKDNGRAKTRRMNGRAVFNPKEQRRRKRSAVPLESSNGVANPLKQKGKSEMETISYEKPAKRIRLCG